MRRHAIPPARLISLANAQGGCLTRRQCLAAGLSAEQTRGLARGWVTLARGVYCIKEPTWRSRVWAGVLCCRGDAVIGGAAALYLDGALSDEPASILIWRTHTARRAHCPGVVFREGSRPAHGHPVRTYPEDSILDLARGASHGEVIDVLGQVMRSRATTRERLLEAMDRRARVSHRRLITELCTDLVGVDSPLELRFAKDVVEAHQLVRPLRQVPFFFARLDCYWPWFGLAVELDGERYHKDRRFRDMERDNFSAAELGIETLRYGWADVVGRPCDVAAQIAAVLHRKGWSGRLARCPRCRTASAA